MYLIALVWCTCVTELLDVCDLVACNAQTLLDALTSRTVNAMKEAVKTDLSATEARARKSDSVIAHIHSVDVTDGVHQQCSATIIQVYTLVTRSAKRCTCTLISSRVVDMLHS